MHRLVWIALLSCAGCFRADTRLIASELVYSGAGSHPARTMAVATPNAWAAMNDDITAGLRALIDGKVDWQSSAIVIVVGPQTVGLPVGLHVTSFERRGSRAILHLDFDPQPPTAVSVGVVVRPMIVVAVSRSSIEGVVEVSASVAGAVIPTARVHR